MKNRKIATAIIFEEGTLTKNEAATLIDMIANALDAKGAIIAELQAACEFYAEVKYEGASNPGLALTKGDVARAALKRARELGT